MFSEKTIEIDGIDFDCTYQTDEEDIHFDSVKVGGHCIVEHLRQSFLNRLEVEIKAAIKTDNDYPRCDGDSISIQTKGRR